MLDQPTAGHLVKVPVITAEDIKALITAYEADPAPLPCRCASDTSSTSTSDPRVFASRAGGQRSCIRVRVATDLELQGSPLGDARDGVSVRVTQTRETPLHVRPRAGFPMTTSHVHHVGWFDPDLGTIQRGLTGSGHQLRRVSMAKSTNDTEARETTAPHRLLPRYAFAADKRVTGAGIGGEIVSQDSPWSATIQ